jgi:large subunit ribosomal protein L30
MLRIKLVKSPIGYTEEQKATVKALGLHRLHQERVVADTQAVRAMVNKVNHLVALSEVSDAL